VQSGGMKTIYDEGDDVFSPDALLVRINVAYGLRVWRLVSKQARTDPARSALSKLPSCVFVGKACVTGPRKKAPEENRRLLGAQFWWVERMIDCRSCKRT